MPTHKTPSTTFRAEGALRISHGPVLRVTLARPERLNALDIALLVELGATIEEAAADPDVRAIVLTGEGPRAFAAGADLSEIANLPDAVAARELARAGQAALVKIAGARPPVIAAVNGYALGGGCELAMACDMRIAARGAHFGMPEVTLGLIPGFGGTQRLAELAGPGVALRLICSGETITAEQALHFGLVEDVVDDEHLHEKVTRLAERIAASPPDAVAAAKRLVRAPFGAERAAAFEREAEAFGERVASAASREAIAQFFASRRSAR